MRNAETILATIREKGEKGLHLEDVDRQLYNPDLFLRVYGRFYKNTGAMTRGTTVETVDGMSVGKIQRIIGLLRDERYRWSPYGARSSPTEPRTTTFVRANKTPINDADSAAARLRWPRRNRAKTSSSGAIGLWKRGSRASTTLPEEHQFERRGHRIRKKEVEAQDQARLLPVELRVPRLPTTARRCAGADSPPVPASGGLSAKRPWGCRESRCQATRPPAISPMLMYCETVRPA
jgi:hypothetical protein